MALYYYLISSLPDLRTDAQMPITYDEWLQSCQSNVSEEKFEFLQNLTLDSSEGPLIREWAFVYGNLMRELSYQRSMRMGKSYGVSYDKDSEYTMVASAALAAKNPLEAEKILLDYEFDVLDSLVGLHTFDDIYLFGYAVKLRLLERQSCFVPKKGQEEFKRLFDGVQQQVYSL
ncbi:MAG: hypothetical protein HUJ76_02150 [Parasporobacterium sp.]|nr:hypothetical protein [Parasporobacterium sp.]